MNLEPCPPDDQLAELAEGALATDRVSDVHRHLRGCSKCRMVLAGLGAAQELDDEPPGLGASISPEPVAEPPRPGAMINRFRLDRLVGRGGMGSVWAATDPELGRQVALKLLFVGIGSDGDKASSRARLLREAQAMARLSHPNVIPVFEIGEEQGRLFLVMELVEGETLAQWLNQPRPLEQILDKFLAAGDGLAAAHAAGVVHRDFKPENVLVGKDGRARVTDFGLARGHLPTEELTPELEKAKTLPSGPRPAQPTPADTARGQERPMSQRALDEIASAITLGSIGEATLPSALTPMGALLGTPAYMSPEQMRGQRADARSDVFAFCTALFEAIFRARPYPAKTLLEMRTRIEAGGLVWPQQPRIPGYLRAALAEGLQASPLERPDSMEALLATLRRGKKRAETRWGLLAGVASLALLLGLGGALLARRAREAAGPRTLAVLSPANRSKDGNANWIAAVLSELVTSDLAGEAKLRLVPAADVAAALRDLSVGGASLKPEEVARLRTRLSADLILGGDYSLAPGGAIDARLALWDPRGREVELAQAGDEAHLIDLGTRLSAQARAVLGLPARPPATGSFPADVEAARLYAEGLQLERSQATAKATVPLEKAVSLAPENARIQLALAEAYVFVRREVPARQAASIAFAHKSELPADEQPRAEVLYYRTMGDTARAVALARQRFEEQPRDLQRGLELIDELTNADQTAAALEVVARLRKLPPPDGDDARVDLGEALSCWLRGDSRCALDAAERAYRQAEARGARLQMEIALYRQGSALRKLGQVDKSLEALAQSEKLADEVGDFGSAAGARVMMGTIYADQGDLPRAKEIFEKATALYAAEGDRRSEASTLHNLAVLMRRARDIPAALGYANRAVTLWLELGVAASAATSLTTLGNLRTDMGDLAGAEEVLQRAAAIRREAKNPQLSSTIVSLITVELLRDRVDAAEKLLAEGRATDNGQDKVNTGRLEWMASLIAEVKRQPGQAAAEAQKAIAIFNGSALVDEEALARATLCRAELAQDHTAAARQAIDPATAILAKSKGRLARTAVMICDTRVHLREHPADFDGAVARLQEQTVGAARSGASDEDWSVRLAIAKLELEAKRPGAKGRVAALAREARSQGFELYAAEAEEAVADADRARR